MPAWTIILLSTLLAQDVTIHTRVSLVITPVTVTDKRGHFVDGLEESDFLLLDNGKSQPLHMDTSDIAQTPISLVVAVQATEVSGPALAKIRKVGSLIQPLITGDRGEAAVLSFTNEIRVLQDFTHDTGRISSAFRTLKPGGSQAHAIDAVAEAIEHLRHRPENSRKIILLIAESRDRGSKASLIETLQLAQRHNVTIYPLTFSIHATPWTSKPEDAPPISADGGLVPIIPIIAELSRLAKTNTAEEMAKFTGGNRVSFLTLKSLENDLTKLGEALHSQYLLSFAPDQNDPNRDFHTLEVTVKNRPDLIVQARPGYWP